VKDHPTIYLQPWCIGCERADGYSGRLWCQDDVWGACDECDQKSVKYVIAPAALSTSKRGGTDD